MPASFCSTQGNSSRRKILFCASEFLRGSKKGLIMATISAGGLNFISTFLKTKSLESALRSMLSQDTKRFVLFLSCFIGSFRAVNSFLIAFVSNGKDKQINAFIAGVLASFFLLLDNEKRRRSLSMFLLARAVDLVIKKYVREEKLPYLRYSEQILFGMSNVPIMYGFLIEPSILEASYYNWILRMGNVTDEQLYLTGRVVRNARLERGEILPFRGCNAYNHTGPCAQYITMDWVLAFFRAAKIYLPVHLIPIILFRLHHFASLQKVLEIGEQYVVNVIQSCLFLSTYVFIIRFNTCFWRRLCQFDHEWMPVVAGLMTSLACRFERPSRVSELMLFCWPKALEASWRFLAMKGWVREIKYGELPLFAVSAGILLSSRREDYKQTYFNLVRLIIGKRKLRIASKEQPKSDSEK